ncbi:formate/nitrite transporter family protein [Demequina sp. NBRC 110056]|uniref:formate/nitrite transporter family protein n=1 Tax=Demequina sp. NBRC 110056 TaxID=1570345 RepID=UPI0009FC7093|nr:formate/nitrite transporter family protein [Demequina sp. NBRC 110056]
MLSIPDAVALQADAAATKVRATRTPWRFLVSAMLAGLWVGVGVFVMFSAAGPFYVADDPATRLVSGAVFAIALTLVVFAGAELATSAMMILPMGVMRRTITWFQGVRTLAFVLVGNFLGSLLLAWVLIQSGIFHDGATGGMLDGILTSKMSHTASETFFLGILCNVLVCVAIWAASRVRSEAAKAILIFWGVFGFIASGFEHVVANMTIFGIGVLGGASVDVTWLDLGHNLLWAGLGNLVGGMVVMAMGYTFIAGRRDRDGSSADALVADSLDGADASVESGSPVTVAADAADAAGELAGERAARPAGAREPQPAV